MALLYFSVIILALIASHPIRYKIWKTRIERLLTKIKCSSTFSELEDFELHELSKKYYGQRQHKHGCCRGLLY